MAQYELLLVILLPEYSNVGLHHCEQSRDNRGHTIEVPRARRTAEVLRQTGH